MVRKRSAMVRTRSMTAVLRNRNLIKTKAAAPKSKRKAAQPKSKRKAAQLKRAAAAAAAAEEEKKMMEAFHAVDVEKILRLTKEALEAMETCFPMTARAKLAEAAARARLAAARGQSVAEEEEKVPEKKKKVVKHLVPQGYIDRVKAGLFNFVDEIPEDKLAKESQLFRDTHRGRVVLNDKIQACQQFILDQYDAFGYAYDVEEVSDDEAEDEGEVVLKK